MKKRQTSSQSFSRLWQLMMRDKLVLSLLILLTLVQVLLTVYLPILVGRAVDLVVQANINQKLLYLLLEMVTLIVVNTVIQWLTPLLANRIIYKLIRELRQEVFEKIHSLPLKVLDRMSIGDLTSRISSDAEQLTNGLIMIFNQFLVGVLTILATIFMMASLDIWMMLVVVVLTPLSLFVARYIVQKSYQLYRHQTQARGQQSALLEESMGQLSLIQTFSAQEQFVQQFEETNQAYAQYSQSAIFASSTINPSTRFINALIYALLAWIGALRIMTGQFTVGSLTTFLSYASQYTKPFNDISSVLSELQSALACADRLFAILDEESIVEANLADFDAEEIKGQVSFDGVAFSYTADNPLIEDLTINIPSGSKVAIVGPTGAGKSTLINLLMRFYEVDRGQILLDGKPITDYSRESLRKMIGMVLQETWIKTATIHDNIAYGYPNATRELVIEAAQAANADFFIRQLPQGYDTYLDDAGESLSQGQRQLLAIARVFVKLPKMLILDEATSSIDTRTEILIQEAFQKLMQGRTSFIIAHRLSTIQSADLILVMNDGKIIEQGTHQSLMAAKGLYYQMQASQGLLDT